VIEGLDDYKGTGVYASVADVAELADRRVLVWTRAWRPPDWHSRSPR